MLPRWHIFLGAAFTLAFAAILPDTHWIYLTLIFLSSFLIDFDHYMAGARKSKTFNLTKVLRYHDLMLLQEKRENERGIRRRGDFHIFHTLEFHIIVALLGFVWVGFWYILIGMVFHSLLDIISLLYGDRLYRREYFFFAWLAKNI